MTKNFHHEGTKDTKVGEDISHRRGANSEPLTDSPRLRGESSDALRARAQALPSQGGAEIGPWLERCYFARIPTRRLARCRSHTLRYAV